MAICPSPAELASELNRHLGDPKAAEEMRERGARLAAEHTWERVAEAYLDMYHSHGTI